MGKEWEEEGNYTFITHNMAATHAFSVHVIVSGESVRNTILATDVHDTKWDAPSSSGRFMYAK
jgi:hypothetical protein